MLNYIHRIILPGSLFYKVAVKITITTNINCSFLVCITGMSVYIGVYTPLELVLSEFETHNTKQKLKMIKFCVLPKISPLILILKTIKAIVFYSVLNLSIFFKTELFSKQKQQIIFSKTKWNTAIHGTADNLQSTTANVHLKMGVSMFPFTFSS